MKNIIIGAGISGLSIGKMLNKEHDLQMLERHSFIGGIVKTEMVERIAYQKLEGNVLTQRIKRLLM